MPVTVAEDRLTRVRIGARSLWLSAGFLTLFSTLSSYQAARISGRRDLYVEIVLLNTCYWLLWVPLVPAIVAVAQRFGFDARAWPRALAIHLPIAVVLSAFHLAVFALLQRPIAVAGGFAPPSWWSAYKELSTRVADQEMMAYWMIVGAALAVAYREEARIRALDAARLETQLVQTQLNALQSQLQPHFLFNALNVVSALMHRDVMMADRTLARLADLLRTTLRHVDRRDAPVREEIEMTRNYIDIEQTRFQDRLNVRFDVSPETLNASIPWMLLQPLVENAVKHGIAPQRRGGTIEIVVRRDGERLRISVRDDGVGLHTPAGGEPPTGTGLSTVRARLRYQFGDAHEFALVDGRPGLEVRIAIPWRCEALAHDAVAVDGSSVA